MSRWASNTTWLELQGSKSAEKRVKRARHVALGVRHDALGLQHDVARVPRVQIPQKRVKRARHVALGVRHVALEGQRDVAPQLQTPSYCDRH